MAKKKEKITYKPIKLTADDLGIELMCCPFCGCNEVELSNTWTPAYSVECQTCNASIPGESAEWSKTEQAYEFKLHRQSAVSAAETWNNRAPTALA